MDKAYVRAVLVFFMALFCATAFAQDSSVPLSPERAQDTTTTVKKDTARQKDMYDVIHSIFHSSPPAVKSTIITDKPIISVVPALGYSLQTQLALTLSGNIIFRRTPESRISTITGSAAYTTNEQVIVPLFINIWSKNNNYNFVGDYRFLKYPQSTFGLGSSSNPANEDPMDYISFHAYQSVLRRIGGNFYAGLGYIFDQKINVTDKGNIDRTVSDYSLYGKESNTTSSGLTFNFQFDSRDNLLNAGKGFFASVKYRDNYKFLGSTFPWRSLIVDMRKYITWPEGSDNVLALWSYDWLILSGKPPYLDLPATAFDANYSTGRGYIQGRFRGAQMVYLESEYRFKITQNGLIGGVIFLNAESFSAQPGTSLQTIQPAAGPGLRVKLNKISKTNICIDYGIGRQGSNGVFVNVGEVF